MNAEVDATPYQVLQVDRAADPEIIRAAYRILTKRHHPDRGGDVDRFHQVQHAWEILRDPIARRRLDVQLFGGTADWDTEEALPAETPAEPELTGIFAVWKDRFADRQVTVRRRSWTAPAMLLTRAAVAALGAGLLWTGWTQFDSWGVQAVWLLGSVLLCVAIARLHRGAIAALSGLLVVALIGFHSGGLGLALLLTLALLLGVAVLVLARWWLTWPVQPRHAVAQFNLFGRLEHFDTEVGRSLQLLTLIPAVRLVASEHAFHAIADRAVATFSNDGSTLLPAGTVAGPLGLELLGFSAGDLTDPRRRDATLEAAGEWLISRGDARRVDPCVLGRLLAGVGVDPPAVD